MRRGEDISVDESTTAAREWTIRADDLELRDRPPEEPVNLLGKRVRWRVYPHALAAAPLFDYSTDAPTEPLTLADAENGLVRLSLSPTETSVDPWNGRYYLTVHDDAGNQYTAVTGSYVVIE